MPTKSKPSEFVTPDQAAEILGLGRSTVYRLIAQGRLTLIHPEHALLRRADLADFKRPQRGRPKKTV